MTHANYNLVFNAAVDLADKCQMDAGIEKMNEFGRTVYSAKLLPKPENRYGWELRCEVVKPGAPKVR